MMAGAPDQVRDPLIDMVHIQSDWACPTNLLH